MNEPRRHYRYTYAEYVAIEQDSPIKHEFFDGEIIVMSGGSGEHSALGGEMARVLGNAIGDRPCRVHNSDLRVYVEVVGLTTYPDAAVICGPLLQHEPSPHETALNPMILVEVTSPSSEAYDTGDKLTYYQMIPTLREYVIVSHRERRITVHVREEGGTWSTRVAIKGGAITLPSLDAELVVDEIYRDSAIE